MPVEIRVPTLGESVVEATVGSWFKQEGEAVRLGEPLVELETDKVNTELPADDTGVLERILAPVGETVRPGDVIGVIATGAAAALPDAAPGAPAPEPLRAAAAAPASPSTAAAPNPPSPTANAPAREVRASPMAERLAGDLGINLADVQPDEPGGRITKEDVQAYADRRAGERGSRGAGEQGGRGAGEQGEQGGKGTAPAPQPVLARPSIAQSPISNLQSPSAQGRPETRQRLSRRRLTIARRLVEAQQTTASLTTFNEIDMTAVMEVRKRRRDAFKERHGVGLGFMSFFTRAVIGALRAFPQVNAELQGDELILRQYYDIGIAIGDAEGLVVPVLRNAHELTFAQIEQAIAAFAQKARDRALTIEDLQGGTFTITNGGVFGSLLSTPILNPPQVGILGMHKIQERPVVVNGEIVPRPMMYVALTYDHRVVDGREAVQFLVRVKELVEDPERLLLEG